MHHVSSAAIDRAKTPEGYEPHSSGFRRTTYVTSGIGAVHVGVGMCYLEPHGSIQRHLHSFEESYYILQGNPIA